MQHFNAQNRDEIPDAKPDTWATVLSSDVETLSDLARRGFHIMDMRGRVWIVRRVV